VGDRSVKEQVALLVTSAKLILRIREVIVAGNIEQAGILADEALQQKQLHYSAVDELRLYSKEINSALTTIQLLQSFRLAMKEGDILKLQAALDIAKNTDSNYSYDLGILLTIDRAEAVYHSLLDIKRQLASLASCYDRQTVIDTIDLARSFSMSEAELLGAKTRLLVLSRFEDYITVVEHEHHGAITGEEGLQRVIEYAHELNLASHPKVTEAILKRSLSAAAFRTTLIAECLVKSNVFVIATETIKVKQQYLLASKATIDNYRIERFSQLRRPNDFGMRMCIPSEDLRKTMLVHSDQPLPTSLTKQSPGVAALSVIMFSHYIRGIERSMYSDLRIVLRKLLQLGRAFPPIRDEMLLQIIKQVRNNSDLSASTRLWRCLHACLYHFPPSMEFESYLESFMLINGFEHPQHLIYSQVCIRSLHQSVIRFGYHVVVGSAFEDSLEEMHRWLTCDYYDPLLTATSQNRDSDPTSSVCSKESVDNSAVTAASAYPHSNANTKNKLRKKASIASTTDVTRPIDPAFIVIGRTLEDAMRVVAVRRDSMGPMVVRGSQDDWMQRFQKFCPPSSKGNAPDHRLNKQQFMAAIAASNAADCPMDRIDRDIFYFLLFGKQGTQVKAIVREYLTSHRLYHSSKEEASQSKVRCALLSSSIRAVDKSSELFFSQLKPSDLSLYADRFWSLIVDPLHSTLGPSPNAVADAHTPHAAIMSSATLSTVSAASITDRTADIVISCDAYRDIVLVGMKKYVEKIKFGSSSHVSSGTSSSSSELQCDEDRKFDLTEFSMCYADDMKTI